MPSLSSSLLVRVQEMQPDAWARLVDVFSPIIYRWARQAGLSGADSADVVQEVFASIARRISSFERQKEKGSFRSWLATITRNQIRDAFRRKHKQPDGRGGSTAMMKMMDTPGPELEAWEATVSVENLESRLPERVLSMVRADCDEKTWQAFWGTTIEEKPASQVADELGLSIASVYQAKSRTLRRLRKRMDEIP
jgi:RNA polymerase sigma-70 factor (ECF subfamily)